MRRASLLLVLALACTSAHTPSRRVVLVSFDGLGADELAKQTGLPTFAMLQRIGRFVERVTPVTPSVTSSSHVALLTGTPPSVNGIVGNRFLRPGTKELADGFSADIEAETLVEAAHRAHKRVGSIAFPTIDGRNARRSADFALVYSDAVERSRMIHFTRADFQPWHNSMRATLAPGVDLIARDTTDDHIVNYDLFMVHTTTSNQIPNPWFTMYEQRPDGLYGNWSKLMRASPTLDDVTIYWGAVHRTVGYPDSFRRMVEREIGFWPGPADEKIATDEQTFAEQNARFCAFLAQAAELAIRRIPFDLLLVYEPPIDKAQHQNLAVAQAFESADGAIKTMAGPLDPARDALIVTGDHGLAAVDTEVHLKRLLDDWGFGDWTAVATGGGVAHLYGTSRREELKARLAATGFIERIDPKSHPNSGDLVLYAYPNVALSAAGGEPVTKPRGYGQHGGIGSHHEFQTVLMAWGAGIAREVVPEMQQTEIAGYVSGLLGIRTPRGPVGSASALRGFLRRSHRAPVRPQAAARPSSRATSD